MARKGMFDQSPVKRTDRFTESHPESDGWKFTPAPISVCGMHCCGVREIHGIQNYHTLQRWNKDGRVYDKRECFRVMPEDIVTKVIASHGTQNEGRARPFYIFIDNFDYGIEKKRKAAGQELLEYIVEHKLGKVFRTGKEMNENSGNKIECFTWVIDWAKLLKFQPKTEKAKAAA